MARRFRLATLPIPPLGGVTDVSGKNDMDDKELIKLVVAEVIRRAGPDTPTEHFLRVALQTEAKLEAAIKGLREEVRIVARSK